MHWTTLEKILEHPSPPGYRRSQRPGKPKIDPYLDRIREILEQDKHADKKQRHTAKKIWERLQQEGFTGGYTIVKDVVRELKRTSQEVFMPLKHPPGRSAGGLRACVGEDGGVLRKVCFFVMTLPYSDAFFVRAYERECTETFWDGHVRAFAFFGGVPGRINLRQQQDRHRQDLGSAGPRSDPGIPAVGQSLPVRLSLLPGPAGQ